MPFSADLLAFAVTPGEPRLIEHFLISGPFQLNPRDGFVIGLAEKDVQLLLFGVVHCKSQPGDILANAGDLGWDV